MKRLFSRRLGDNLDCCSADSGLRELIGSAPPADFCDSLIQAHGEGLRQHLDGVHGQMIQSFGDPAIRAVLHGGGLRLSGLQPFQGWAALLR